MVDKDTSAYTVLSPKGDKLFKSLTYSSTLALWIDIGSPYTSFLSKGEILASMFRSPFGIKQHVFYVYSWVNLVSVYVD